MNEILEFIIDIIWLFDLAGLAAFGVIAKKQAKVNSSLISLIVVIAFAGIMLGYQALLQHFDSASPSKLIQFLWYMVFTLFYLLLIMSLRWVHALLQTPIGSVAKLYTNVATLLGIISLLQYAEIVLFKTDTFFDWIYTVGIPFINVISSVFVMCMGFHALYKLIRSTESKLELRWTI